MSFCIFPNLTIRITQRWRMEWIIVEPPYLVMFNCTLKKLGLSWNWSSCKDKLLLCLLFKLLATYFACLYICFGFGIVQFCSKTSMLPCLVIFCSMATFFLHKTDGISNCVCAKRGSTTTRSLILMWTRLWLDWNRQTQTNKTTQQQVK